MVIDIDDPTLVDTFPAKIQEKCPDLFDALCEVQTRSAKKHLWLRTEEPFGKRQTFGKYDNNKDAIEFRADGCYVVGPGSDGYQIVRGDVEDLAIYSSAEVQQLINIARSFERVHKVNGKSTRRTRDTIGDATAEFGGSGNDNNDHGIGDASQEFGNGEIDRSRPGDDFNESHSWDYIFGELLDPPYTLIREDEDGSQYWKRPGGKSEWSCRTGLISEYGRDQMHCFSTGCEFFEASATYDMFGAYAAIFHDNDIHAASRNLRQLGYGQQVNARNEPEENVNAWPDPPDNAIYQGAVGEYAKSIVDLSECDPVAVLVQSLVVLGNLVGKGPYFQIERDRHYSKLFAVIVGNTSEGRKGTALGYVASLVEAVEEGYSENNIATGLSTGAGLIHCVRDAELVTSNRKKHVDLGIADKRIVVVQPEFAALLEVMGRAGNDLSHVIRDAWDNRTLQNMSKCSPERATGSHLSIVGHITPRELVAKMDRTSVANGFANRFVYICARRTQLLPHGGQAVTDEHLAQYARRLQKAIKYARKLDRITWDSEARVGWEAVYPTLSSPDQSLVGELLARGPAQVLRLSLVYAILDGAKEIGMRHLEAACALWEFSERSVRYVFESAFGGNSPTGDPVADRIHREFLSRGSGAVIAKNEILEVIFKRNVSASKVAVAMDLLMDNFDGYEEVELPSTGGRKAKGWKYTR